MSAPRHPAAADPRGSRGRRHPEPPPHRRSEYQRDRDRIVHSTAFRRLEYKTQVFVNHEGDHYRTRLTHTLEVAQIARTCARSLGLDEDLTEAIALAHDLGHTPFGHAGEDALAERMAPYGGFEHNLQSLRVVDRLETRYAAFDGLNLTFETREGLLKRCPAQVAEGLGEVARRFVSGGQPSLEAQLVNACDGIAYNSHDVDDGWRAGMLDPEALARQELLAPLFAALEREHPRLEHRRRVHEIRRRLIDVQVEALLAASEARLAAAAPADAEAVRNTGEPLIGFDAEMAAAHEALKAFLFEQLYRHYRVTRSVRKAQRVVAELFDAFLAEPGLMPPPHAAAAAGALPERARAVADYIAGMTDRYALAEHDRLHDPHHLG